MNILPVAIFPLTLFTYYCWLLLSEAFFFFDAEKPIDHFFMFFIGKLFLERLEGHSVFIY